ncbi:MAG: twin-arginine translocase subunit TatC [Alphaproteobacteria bacterium]|nr:twin-arginine translocase subunit TatC [Alphaproteobacteria bacterium]
MSAPESGPPRRAVEPPGADVRKAELQRRLAETEDQRLARELEEVESFRMPLMEHLKELSRRLIRSLVAFAIGMGVGLYFAKDIYAFISAPFVAALEESGIDGGLSLVSSPFEGVFTYFKVSAIAAVLVASPVISYESWAFIAPGLLRSERRLVVPLAVSSLALFLTGAAFCFYGIFPYAFPFFITTLGVDVNISVDGYLSSTTFMMLAFGACFQLPVVAFFLARAGLVDHRDLWSFFRYAVVGIFILAAIITPPDPLTQVLLAVPMVVLYLVGIVVAYLFSTKEPTPAAST